MKTSIRGLRTSMKRILDAVQHGKVVVIYSRKHPIAKIVPMEESPQVTEDKNYGFGMWSDYAEMADVTSYVRKLRKGRRHDI